VDGGFGALLQVVFEQHEPAEDEVGLSPLPVLPQDFCLVLDVDVFVCHCDDPQPLFGVG